MQECKWGGFVFLLFLELIPPQLAYAQTPLEG